MNESVAEVRSTVDRRTLRGVRVRSDPENQQPKTYPNPPIPAARLFLVFLCFSMFSSAWGNPEVQGGDLGFLEKLRAS